MKVALILAVAAGGLIAVTVATRSGSEPERGVRLVNLEFALPSHWHVRPLSYRCGRASVGVLIGNLSRTRLNRVPHDLRGLPPHSCTTIWNVSDMPAGYVLVDITRLSTPSRIPASVFPLTYEGFAPGTIGCDCSFRSGFVVSAGLSYNLRIWIGRMASAADRVRLQQLIGSIRPIQ